MNPNAPHQTPRRPPGRPPGRPLGRRTAPARSRRPAPWIDAAVLTALFCLAGSAPVAAAPETGPPAEGRFVIESITVENARLWSEELIVHETLLRTGSEYGERQIAAAVDRVARLPMILAAESSLRRGSRRGLFELVIRVEEARRWFFRVDGRFTFWSPEVSVNGLSVTSGVDNGTGLAGYRRPAGRRGILFGALSGGDGLLTLGYSRYDLWGRGALLSVSVAISDCRDGDRRNRQEASDPGDEGCQTDLFEPGLDPTASTWSSDEGGGLVRLHLGVPVTGNHSLRLRGMARSRDGGIRRQAYEPATDRFFVFERRHDQDLELSWVYDSTDDPVFATRGARLEAGVGLRHLEADLENVDLRPPFAELSTHMETTRIGLISAGEVFTTVGDHTVSGFGRVLIGRSRLEGVPTADLELLDGDVDTWALMAGGRYSRLLFRQRAPGSWRELRWSTDARVFHRGTSPSAGLPDNPQRGFQLGSQLAYRTTWGLFSLRFEYIDVER